MRLAETVTFGGAGLERAGLDRAAALRGDAAAQVRLLVAGRVLPVWRGKMPVAEGGGLVWLPADHPLFGTAAPIVFLGIAPDGTARFARDISAWQPDAGSAEVHPGFMDQSVQHHPLLDPASGFHELRAVMTALDPLEAELAATARAILQWHRSHGFCANCGAASDMVMAGWQRSCPACGTQHFPRTDPVVIMLVNHGNRTLLGRSAGWPEGMYSCLAGFVEPGETVEAAVRREVLEETGVRVGRVRYLASQPWPFPASLMIGCVAEAESEAITLDPAELEAAFWISREGLLAAMAGESPAIRPARRGSIAHFLLSNWLADRLD